VGDGGFVEKLPNNLDTVLSKSMMSAHAQVLTAARSYLL
jgi:hypothetical protein